MLTEIYIEALLVDEELADQVSDAWDAGEIDDFVATWGWWTIAASFWRWCSIVRAKRESESTYCWLE